jgi:tyrosyl-DNA phosphodiesterase 1
MNQSDDLIRSAQFNYMFQLDWLVSQYPFKFRQCPLTIIHGYQDDREFDSMVHKYQHIESIKAHLLPFGTHHTKMMYLLYNTGLRIVIHTSNLIEQDWDKKTQGFVLNFEI